MKREDHKIFVFIVIFRMLLFCPAVEVMTTAIINFPVLAFLYIYIYLKGNQMWTKLWLLFPVALCVFLDRYTSSWGEHATINYLYYVVQWYLWPMIGFFAVESLSRKSQKILIWAFVFIYFFIGITTYIGNLRTPGASKLMGNGNFMTDESALVSMFKMQNIGDFAMIYTFVPIIPILIGMIKFEYFKNFRLLGFAIIIVLCLAIYHSEYTTAIVIVASSITFIIFPFKKNSKNIKYIIAAAIVLTMIAMPFLGNILDYAASDVASEDVSQRLTELSVVAKGGSVQSTDDFASRIILWSTSLKTFFDYIFLGCYHLGKIIAWPMIGGHSFVLDLMARFGLVGLIMVVWMFKKLYELYVKPHYESEQYPYYFIPYLIILVQSIINTMALLMPLVFLIPLLAEVYNNKEEI